MKEYDWTEVEEFLDKNLERKFNYSNPTMHDRCEDKGGCLMLEFFKSKDELQEFFEHYMAVSGNGFIMYGSGFTDVAKIINYPYYLYDICKIHDTNSQSGKEIRKKLRRLKKLHNEHTTIYRRAINYISSRWTSMGNWRNN